MIGTRTRYPSLNSLALQEPMLSIVLLSRYGVQHRRCRQARCCMGS